MGSPRTSSHLHSDTIGSRNSMLDRSGYNGDVSSRSRFFIKLKVKIN